MESPRLVEKREMARDLAEEDNNPKSMAKTAGKQAPTNTGKLPSKGLSAGTVAAPPPARDGLEKCSQPHAAHNSAPRATHSAWM